MARVRDVQVDEVPADVRPIYERFVQDYGPFMNLSLIHISEPTRPY